MPLHYESLYTMKGKESLGGVSGKPRNSNLFKIFLWHDAPNGSINYKIEHCKLCRVNKNQCSFMIHEVHYVLLRTAT